MRGPLCVFFRTKKLISAPLIAAEPPVVDPVSGPRRSRRRLLIPLAVWALLTLGCSATSLVQRQIVATPFPTRAIQPTFTPVVEVTRLVLQVIPGSDLGPGVIIAPPGVDPASLLPPTPTASFTPTPPAVLPTETPTPGPSATPTETLVPTPTETVTPTPTPTPFVRVIANRANVRTGPGVDYPVVTQLSNGTQVTLVGRTPQGDWVQICCVNGESVWIAGSVVQVINDVVQLSLVVTGPPPTPTETPTVTPTPTATPMIYAFEIAEGPIYMPTNNAFLSIWGKIFVGEYADGLPLEGYYYDASYEGFERPNTLGDVRSVGYYERMFRISFPEKEKPFNYKYEYKPFPTETGPSLDSETNRAPSIAALGAGNWTIILRDGEGRQMAAPVVFRLDSTITNREIYIGWIRRR